MSFTGTLISWNPMADDQVLGFNMAADGSGLFIVGSFQNVAGPDGVYQSRYTVAKLDTSTGAVLSWAAGCPCSLSQIGYGVTSDTSRVYVAVGGSDWVAGYDITTGAQIWRTDVDGQAQTIGIMGNRLVVGGHYRHAAYAPVGKGGEDNCYNFPQNCAERLRLSAFSLDGFLDKGWEPRTMPDYYGVWASWIDGPALYIGGVFNNVSGTPQASFARLSGG
jgi:hypothetical protein